MSRSGYSEDCYGWELIRWRGAVAAATKGKRGQKLLKDLAKALDEMPEKKLIAHELKNENGEVCALGALGVKRGLKSLETIDPTCTLRVANEFGVAEALIKEIVFENDECAWTNPEKRWQYMRKWVQEQIRN